MPNQGDLHNFGRYVQTVERASGVYFQKPRPIYWEWLFFGNTSPLMPFFVKEGKGTLSPASNLFCLDVETTDDFSGYSRLVEASANARAGNRHAYSLGVLLAYCYVFGIRDLHRHNLIQTSSHLQVVDAEVVLVNLLLPNETLLLPFKNIGPELAAISHLGSDSRKLLMDTITAVLQGYVDTFDCIEKNLAPIQEVFRTRRDEIRRIPIRHIARDTIDYRNWKTSPPKIPFSTNELEQLERGDIPYFFKFVGDPGLYKCTDRSWGFAQASFPEEFKKDVARDATDPEALLNSERIGKTLFPTGLLFLAKCLLPDEFTGSIRLGDLKLSLESNVLKFLGRSQQYQATFR